MRGNQYITHILCAIIVFSASAGGRPPEMPSPTDSSFTVADMARNSPLVHQLDTYFDLALKGNLELARLQTRVSAADAERKSARAKFLPHIDVQTRYSRAEGGREIIIDVNEIMGPLLPPDTTIPPIEFGFLRSREQETRFRVTQPLFTGGALVNAYAARSALKSAAEYQLEAARLDLHRRVSEAYLTYLKAEQLEAIKQEILALTQENLRVTEALYEQDKLIQNDVLRARVMVAEARGELAETAQQQALASRYFNDLLRRASDEPVLSVPLTVEDARALDIFGESSIATDREDLKHLEDMAYENRRELLGLQYSLRAAQRMKRAATGSYLPRISLVADYGWQGEEYRFTRDDDYYMASLVLGWDLFDGLGREAKIQGAAAQVAEFRIEHEIARRRIGLQVEEAYLTLRTARLLLESAEERLRSAEEGYRITQKRFHAGMALALEIKDSLTQLDAARSAHTITLYDYVIVIEKMKNAIGIW